MTKYFRFAYQFGALGGTLSVLAFGLLSFLQPDPTNLNLVFGYVITPVSLFLSIKFFKEYANGGFLSFAEGMSVGFVTYMLIALLSAGGIVLLLLFYPDLFEAIKSSKLAVIETNQEVIISQVGQASFEATRNSLQEMSAWDVGLNDGIWKIVPGLFFTIIISIILRKNLT